MAGGRGGHGSGSVQLTSVDETFGVPHAARSVRSSKLEPCNIWFKKRSTASIGASSCSCSATHSCCGARHRRRAVDPALFTIAGAKHLWLVGGRSSPRPTTAFDVRFRALIASEPCRGTRTHRFDRLAGAIFSLAPATRPAVIVAAPKSTQLRRVVVGSSRSIEQTALARRSAGVGSSGNTVAAG